MIHGIFFLGGAGRVDRPTCGPAPWAVDVFQMLQPPECEAQAQQSEHGHGLAEDRLLRT